MVSVTLLLRSARCINSDRGMPRARSKCGFTFYWPPSYSFYTKKEMFHTCKYESNARICTRASMKEGTCTWRSVHKIAHTFPQLWPLTFCSLAGLQEAPGRRVDLQSMRLILSSDYEVGFSTTHTHTHTSQKEEEWDLSWHFSTHCVL